MHYNPEFYESINKNLKEILDHPVPQILLKENKELIKDLENNPNNQINFEVAEQIVLNYLLKKPLSYAIESFNKDYKYDHKIGFKNTIKTYEVKLVFPEAHSLQLEINKTSFLFKTEADYVVFIIPNQIYDILIFDRKKFLDLIKGLLETNLYPITNDNLLIPYETLMGFKEDILLKKEKV